MFADLSDRIRNTITHTIYHAALGNSQARQQQAPKMVVAPSNEQKAMAAAVGNRGNVKPQSKVGRNDQCPCGSGRKYKKCHGA